MRLSIKHATTAGIIGLMLVTVAVSMVSTYFSTEEVLLGHARDLMETVSDETISNSVEFLEPAQTAARLSQRLMHHRVLGDSSLSQLERYFFEQLRQNPSFSGIYYGLENGSMIFVMRTGKQPGGFLTKHVMMREQGREVHLYTRDADFRLLDYRRDDSDNFDPRVRPWYRKAVASGDEIWTDPYIFFTSNRPGITTASPVFDDAGQSRLKGVIGVDIEISALSTFLAQLNVGEHGSAFMMNRNGDVIAHPQAQLIGSAPDGTHQALIKIDQLDDPRARAAYAALGIASPSQLPSEHKQVISFEIDGTPHQGAFVPFKHADWPWVLGIYVPDNDYLGPLQHNQRNNVLAVIIIGLIATLAGLVLSRSLIRPIEKLGRQAHAITEGDLLADHKIDSRFGEIQDTVNAFSTMNEALLEEQTHSKALNNLLRETSLSTIYRLTEAAEFKNTDTGMQISRMAMLSVHIAVRLGLPDKFCEDLLYAAPMHDIGKLGIPDAILFKEGELSEADWEVIRTHPEIGAHILKNPETPVLELGHQVALTHHEHWDGKGYPEGLKGEQIPIAGRICGLADVFDALVSDRSYKQPMSLDEAFATVRAQSGRQFDPACVAALDACASEARKLYSGETPPPAFHNAIAEI